VLKATMPSANEYRWLVA